MTGDAPGGGEDVEGSVDMAVENLWEAIRLPLAPPISPDRAAHHARLQAWQEEFLREAFSPGDGSTRALALFLVEARKFLHPSLHRQLVAALREAGATKDRLERGEAGSTIRQENDALRAENTRLRADLEEMAAFRRSHADGRRSLDALLEALRLASSHRTATAAAGALALLPKAEWAKVARHVAARLGSGNPAPDVATDRQDKD